MAMLRLLLVFAAFTAAFGQKIALSRTSFSLTSGMVAQVQFRLDAPIICTNQLTECSVTVRITNMNTNAVAMDTCLVKWMRDEWTAVRTVTISARSGFVDDSQFAVSLITSPANSSAVYYTGFDPADITLQTQTRRSAQCVAWGDPHYTTFDGYPWHVYDYNTATLVQHVLYRSTALGRTFEIQTRSWNPWVPHIVQCGVAAREENDLVIIDQCGSSSPRIIARVTSPSSLAPQVRVSGITYEVFFRSGAYLRVDSYSWGFNVYTTAPGLDFNRTVGLCGNNNDNKFDDAPVGWNQAAWAYSTLFPTQRLNGRQDLWTFFPTAASTATMPPYAALCDVIDNSFLPPVLNNPNGNDITNIIKGDTGSTQTLPSFVPPTTTTLAPGVTTAPPLTMDQARTLCNNTIFNSSLARSCAPLFAQANQSDWNERYVTGCALDVVAMGPDPSIFAATMQGLQNECAILGSRFANQLNNVLCPTTTAAACSGRGFCNSNNTCTCNPPFAGADCAISTLVPPTISSVPMSTCDVKGVVGCPGANIIVSGDGFLNAPNLACRFNNSVLPALYMGTRQVMCIFPTFQLTGFSQNLFLSVSNDARLWSNSIPITYYDSNCVLCSSANTCTPNPNSCIIDGVCRANGEVNFENTCQSCNRNVSVTSWSYTYGSFVCAPTFQFNVYSFQIVGPVGANYVLGTVSAVNPIVAGDSNNTLSYSVNSSMPVTLPFAIRPDPANRMQGQIFTTQAINPATVNMSRFPSSFMVYVQDSNGLFATAVVSVTLVSQTTAPQFAQASYSVSLPETAAVGSPVVTLSATPGSAGGPLTYDWRRADSRFSLNITSGQITVAQPLNFWLASSYLLQVGVRDPQNQFAMVSVLINVTYVPKPPTDILLSAATVDEKQLAGTVVANLTSVDPGSHTFTYTITPASVPFAISAGALVTRSVLDFELGPKSYTFNLTTMDENNLSFTKLVTISVLNIIEAPWNVAICPLAGCRTGPMNVPDDTLSGETIGFVNYTETDGEPVTCQVFPASTFFASLENGVYVVRLQTMLSFLNGPTATIMAVCSVGDRRGNTLSSTPVSATINVLNRPKAPQVVTLSLAPVFDQNGGVPETSSNVVIGTVSAVNRDPSASNITFSVPTTDALFSKVTLSTPVCVSNNGSSTSQGLTCSVNVILTDPLTNLNNLNFNGSGIGVVTLMVRAMDSSSQKFVVTPVTVPVTFVNQPPLAPTFVGSYTVVEKTPVNTSVGLLQTNDPHPGLPHTITIIDQNPFFMLVPLTASRRSVQPALLWQVVVANSNISFFRTQQLSFSVLVTNHPPSGNPLSSTFTLTMPVSRLPVTISLLPGGATSALATGASLNVDERTPANTVIGGLQINNVVDRVDLDSSLSLTQDGSGYFTIKNGNLVRTAKFLNYSVVQSLTVQVTATFTRKAGAPVVPFDASATSTFVLRVQPVSTPPALVFLTSSTVATPVASFGAVGTVLTTFQVTSTDNSKVTATLSNDPLQLLAVNYDLSGEWQVTLSRDPLGAGAAAGFYGNVLLTVSTASGAQLSANISVTLNPVDLNLGTNLFDASKGGSSGSSSNSVSSSNVAFIAVGAVVGVAVIVLLVVVAILRRRKRALVNMTTVNEPFYSTAEGAGVVASSAAANPATTDDFASGLNNPMYAWYRPDLSRQDCEEFLVDQVEGAFVIRDSTATPGWHMLAVKTHSAIVHEKIKMSDDGLYELLPRSSNQQPRFHGVPDLVEYYSRQRDGVNYALALDNPLYDNGQMAQRRNGHAVAGAWSYQQDKDAPSVPLKEREKAVMQQIVQATDDDEMYTNAQQAKSVMSSA